MTNVHKWLGWLTGFSVTFLVVGVISILRALVVLPKHFKHKNHEEDF